MTAIKILGKDLDELIVGLKSGSGVIACIIDITYRKNAEPQVKLNVTGVNSEAGERIAWIKDANLAIGDKYSFDIITSGEISPYKKTEEISKDEISKKKLAAYYKLKDELTSDGLL